MRLISRPVSASPSQTKQDSQGADISFLPATAACRNQWFLLPPVGRSQRPKLDLRPSHPSMESSDWQPSRWKMFDHRIHILGVVDRPDEVNHNRGSASRNWARCAPVTTEAPYGENATATTSPPWPANFCVRIRPLSMEIMRTYHTASPAVIRATRLPLFFRANDSSLRGARAVSEARGAECGGEGQSTEVSPTCGIPATILPGRRVLRSSTRARQTTLRSLLPSQARIFLPSNRRPRFK
jgi:hypothetical protein